MNRDSDKNKDGKRKEPRMPDVDTDRIKWIALFWTGVVLACAGVVMCNYAFSAHSPLMGIPGLLIGALGAILLFRYFFNGDALEYRKARRQRMKDDVRSMHIYDIDRLKKRQKIYILIGAALLVVYAICAIVCGAAFGKSDPSASSFFLLPGVLDIVSVLLPVGVFLNLKGLRMLRLIRKHSGAQKGGTR